MKKILTMFMTVIILTGVLTACQGQQNGKGNDQKNDATPTPSAEGNAKHLEGDLSSIIDKIYENKPVDIAVETTAVDLTNADFLKYNTGLDSADKIKEVSVSEAMMTSTAYSLVLIRVNDSTDAEEVAKAVKEGIDPRKWICVEADDLSVVAYGDVVMLVMVDSSLADSVTSRQIVDAFKTVCGGDLTVDLQ